MSLREKVDHGAFELKWLLRSRLLSAVPPLAAADLFAGEGALALSLLKNFREVHAVEIDRNKAARLEKRARAAGLDNLLVHAMDNRRFADEVLPGVRDLTYLDLDAYGCPGPLIGRVFSDLSVERPLAVAVTDGGRLGLLRGATTPSAQAWPDARPRSGGAGLARGPRLSAQNYELMVRAFWKELGRIHGFRVRRFLSAWKRGKVVLYYGLEIEPDRNRMDRDREDFAEPVEP